MSNYQENLEKYKRMQQKKNQVPEMDPMPVLRDRFLGKPLMFVTILMAILLIVTVIGGGYPTMNENISAIATSGCCLALTYAGYRMSQAAGFYRDSRRWLRTPGSIAIKQLSANTRRTEKDTLALTKDIIRRKYYRNLTISKDEKTIRIAAIEPATEKPAQ